MAADWQISSLGELIEVKHGFAFSGAFIQEDARGDILLTPGNFAIGGGFKGDKLKYYDGPVSKDFVLRQGDLLVSMTDLSKQADTLGYPAIVPQCRSGSRYLHNQRLGKVQIKAPDAIDLKFLNYLFRTSEYRHEVLASATGTTVKHTSPERIKRFKFFRPPLDEQRAIAHILGTLDDKIELNWRMNETLAAMSRALFKSWFVDFDPVRVKVEGRNGPLPETIGAHFPHRFSKGKEGRIPEGWFNRELGELVDLQRGTTYKSGLKHLPGPVLLGLASIERNGGFRDRNLSTYGGPSPANLILRPGDMYASLKDVTQSADLLGAVAKVPPYIKQGRLTQDTVKLIFKSAKTSRHIVYQTLLSDDYRVYCRAHATGTTNLGLSRDDFLAFPILQPSEKVQRLFDDAIEQLECRMAIAVGESRTLAALRDTLLPKLISGELRVKAAEKMLEAVA